MFRSTTTAIVLALAAGLSLPSAMATPTHDLRSGSPMKIVKIQYRQSGTDLDTEYIVFRNVTSHRVRVTGWTITSSPATDNQSHTFGTTAVGAGHRLTLYTGKGTNAPGKRFWGSSGPVWNNDGDLAVLANSSGAVVDKCSYAGGGTVAYC
jgi:hypothetical protein